MENTIKTTEIVNGIQVTIPKEAKTLAKFAGEGEIRVKCLQYAANGNDVCEKYEQLKKYADGVYYKDDREWNGYVNRCIYFEENGIFWHETDAPDYFFEKPEAREKVEGLRKGWFDSVKEGAEQGEYIRKLTIEVFRRLGLDTSALMEAREKAIRRQEEEERRKWEEQERKRLEALEAEKKRKAEALEDGRKKLLAFEPITAEQVELLAENIGMKINIRTLGFIRKNVRTATHNENSSVSVSGNVKGRSISGVCNVIWELYKAYKAEAEQMDAAQEAAERERQNRLEVAFIRQAMEHKKVEGYKYGNYILYRRNEMFYVFGKEMEIIKGYFDGSEYRSLSDFERELDGDKFIVFSYHHYNGEFEGDIREFLEQKHVAEFGKPSNGLITVFDAEEVEYWHKYSAQEAEAEAEAQAEAQTRRKTAERINEQARRLKNDITLHYDMKKMCFPDMWDKRFRKVHALRQKYIDNIYKAAGVSDNDGARKNNAVWRHFAVPASVYAK